MNRLSLRLYQKVKKDRLIISNEIESVVKKTNKIQDQTTPQLSFTKHLKLFNIYLFQTIPKNREEGIILNLFYKASINLITEPKKQ